MTRATGTLLPAFAAVCLSSCLPNELPVAPRTIGSGGDGPAYDMQLCMGMGYGDQIWFDLGSGMEVARNSKLDWDLAFAGHADEQYVRMNGARLVSAYTTAQVQIEQPTDTTGFGPGWKWDHSQGSPDSLALGHWWLAPGTVYVIDLGKNLFGASMGLRKLQVLGMTADAFSIRVARLDGTQVQEHVVHKDPARRYVHFNLRTGQQVTIAPPDGAYDLLFTGYNHQFYDPFMLYAVSGVVNAFSGARVAELTQPDFAAVSLNDTIAHPFSLAEDAVGYDWKQFTGSVYVVFPEKVYIVHTAHGTYFKVRFIDFYDAASTQGCPRFEVVGL